MKPVFSLFILTAIILTSVASAVVYSPNYVYDSANNQLADVSVIGFVCDNSDCTSNRQLWSDMPLNTGNDNAITLTYPTKLISSNGYFVYFYKPGYIPAKQGVTLNGDGTAESHKVYLSKITGSASAQIDSLQVIEKDKQIKITAKILSPRINKDSIKFIPNELKNEYYSDKVKATLKINGNVVETKNLNMLWSTEQNIEFYYTPVVGDYNIELITEITDYKFTNKRIESQTKTIKITEEKPQPPIDNIKPIITITSPESRQYTNSNIRFVIIANEPLSEAWVIFNGGKVSLDKITDNQFSKTLYLENGNYIIGVYAKDIAGNSASNQVAFSVDVDTDENHNNEDDEDNDDSENENHQARYVDDDYYRNKYFDQFQTGKVINSIEEQKNPLINDNTFYWIISIFLISIICDLILLILILSKR